MSHAIRWTAQKIARRLALIEPLVYRRREPLPPFRYLPLPHPQAEPPVGREVDDSGWQRLAPPTHWAEPQQDFVLRTELQVPTHWENEFPVALFLPLGEAGDFSHPEALAYLDGIPYAACDRHHQEILLPPTCRDGQPHLLALHGWSGLGGWGVVEPGIRLLMRPCQIVQLDQPTRDFIATARVALGIATTLEEDALARSRLLDALDAAFRQLETREPFGDAFYESVPAAHALLRDRVPQAGPPLEVELVAAGHAHIDLAWLWTLGQTRRKAGRTFHTVLRLMEQFPDYRFSQSQPQLYEFVRQDYPELFEAIKARVAEGRWEPLGGMWVEADCNVSGPEALARQFLLGRRYFREHFGEDAESPVLWLPDVFGYAWNLPQLIKQAGLEYFFTIKIGWNQYNRLPYDSFWWQGLDGTKVLTHFSTAPEGGSRRHASTYNARVSPEQVLGSWQNFQQKELPQPLLMVYGFGDGGGGPTREMLENVREMASFPATPQLRAGRVGDFFRRLEETAGERLPIWHGELYLELHRGTYTTQARSKRANRKSEFLLHDAEFLATLAHLLDPGYEYPAALLRRAWEILCLNQFHDILPGSSIGAVYEESLAQYAEIEAVRRSVSHEALAVIAANQPGELRLINPTSFVCEELALWGGSLPPTRQLQREDGTPVLSQASDTGTLLAAGPLAPYSVTPLYTVEAASPSPLSSLTATETLLENDFLRIEFNEAGDLIRLYDKQQAREVLPPGAIGNEFQLFEDRPLAWDAWDIDVFYDDKRWSAGPATSVRVVEAGPLRATLEIQRPLLSSTLTQRVSLCYHSARLDFDTVVAWRERHILLKVAFPVEVFSPTATYEIQWGNVERPTHRNTSWEWGRFESCAQKWVDLSEGGYGVSLLNDCKYGHDIHDNILRLTLLRSPTWPDPEADQGTHRFRYALLPHAGRWDERTIAAAYALNDPLIVAAGSGTAHRPAFSLLSVDRPNVIIETIKQAEDGRGIIVRLYESQRQRGPVTLTAGFEIAEAWYTNLLEEEQHLLPVDQQSVRLSIRPYEIITLRLLPA